MVHLRAHLLLLPLSLAPASAAAATRPDDAAQMKSFMKASGTEPMDEHCATRGAPRKTAGKASRASAACRAPRPQRPT